jgi:hypothetical protein
MHWKSPNKCELCQKDLLGFAEINSEVMEVYSTITVKESLLVDFAFCKICHNFICKESCLDSKTGYCKPCGQDFNSSDFSENHPLGSIYERRLTDDILSSEIIF